MISAREGIGSLKDLVAMAKAKPGQVTYGSPGTGSINQLATEWLASAAGVKLLHNLPFVPQLPELGAGLGVRLDYAATPDSELAFESMQVYAKQGDLDRYQGPAGEAAIEVPTDLLDHLGSKRELFEQLADKPVSIRRRFGVSTGTGRAWLNRSQSGCARCCRTPRRRR